LKIYNRSKETVGGRRGDNCRKVKFKQHSPMWLRAYKNSDDKVEGRKNKCRKWKFKGIRRIWLKANHRLKYKVEERKKNKGKRVRFKRETQITEINLVGVNQKLETIHSTRMR
jgi:hypothetical protein